MEFKGQDNSLYSLIALAPPNEGRERKYSVSSEPKTMTTTMMTTTHKFALDEIKKTLRDIKDERERRAALAKNITKLSTELITRSLLHRLDLKLQVLHS